MTIVPFMQTIGCALTFAAFPALSIGGLGLLLTSVVSAFVVSLVHVSAPVGEDFDAALLEALETHESKNARAIQGTRALEDA